MTYRERLTPAWWIHACAIGLAVGIGLSLGRISDVVGLAGAVVSAVVLEILLARSTPVVAVQDGVLRAGRAHVPLTFLGEPSELDATATRRATGPELDARAYLCLRGWIPTAVRVPLTDPDDPTPYWLVSSRQPDRLAAALRPSSR